ncbi:hypothetical protein B0H14DRAFT_2570109 [Mycena olivaceomarginata]|nr:hypothetical protein B0H14DRAFT_2570109 [Mycena olivaceomarginata]
MMFPAALFALVPFVVGLPSALHIVSNNTAAAMVIRPPSHPTSIYLLTTPPQIGERQRGNCMLWHGKSNACVTLPPNFNDALSSFGPDTGQDCFIFVETGCSSSTFGPIQHPGFDDLELIGWNNAISSFKCIYN